MSSRVHCQDEDALGAGMHGMVWRRRARQGPRPRLTLPRGACRTRRCSWRRRSGTPSLSWRARLQPAGTQRRAQGGQQQGSRTWLGAWLHAAVRLSESERSSSCQLKGGGRSAGATLCGTQACTSWRCGVAAHTLALQVASLLCGATVKHPAPASRPPSLHHHPRFCSCLCGLACVAHSTNGCRL